MILPAHDLPPGGTATPGACSAAPPPRPAWFPGLRRFEERSLPRALWQLANSAVPYFGTMALMYVAIRNRWPSWIVPALALVASGFMVRLFILFHDCVHGSLLSSRRAEATLGRILGVVVFTPFGEWGHCHLGHHATAGNLDARGIGDVWTMTLDEYLASSRVRRLCYRVSRQPLFMLIFGPLLVFLVFSRIPPRGVARARVMSVLWTNAALAAVVTLASLTIGLKAYLMIQLPTLFFGGVWGIWLFYVQHQFVGSYWARGADWSWLDAALRGSSYYKLPKVLQWFSGNIGLHHVHHLRPRIPNYNLQRCLDETPELRTVEPLTLVGSVRCARAGVWDERGRTFVAFDRVEAFIAPRRHRCRDS